MKLLLHTCCAPCSVYCIDSLRKENIEPTVYWFNPNIHPYMEYKARRDCLKEYTKMINVNAIFEENYGLDEFCKNVVNDLNNRCKNYCYYVRLEQTAKYAKENGYTAFSTTLLVSPYQNHDALVEVAKMMAKKYDIEFLYRDFRVGFREGQAKARELGLYMQKYCGCIFSEEDRYSKQIKKDKENIKDNIFRDGSGSNIKDNSVRVIKGSLFAIITSTIFLIVFAVLLTYTNLSETSITPVVLAVVGISILTGSYFSTRKIQQNGILNGAIVGIVYMLILYIISSMIFMDFSLKLSSLIMIGCGMIAGIIGGIIGVNVNK